MSPRMVLLGVNIDHIAMVRQARRGKEPDPVRAAKIAEDAGADSITVHLREDRRHIQETDVRILRKRVQGKLNLEMASTPEMVRFAARVKPDDVCIVPERRQELTTEGGLDVCAQKKKLAWVLSRLKKAGIRVSLFIDPQEHQVLAAGQVGADCVELHTGAYAGARNRLQRALEFRKLVKAGKIAREMGLALNAGHGLGYENVVPVARIRGMQELNIGYSIVSRALFVGLESAVREMKSLIQKIGRVDHPLLFPPPSRGRMKVGGK